VEITGQRRARVRLAVGKTLSLRHVARSFSADMRLAILAAFIPLAFPLRAVPPGAAHGGGTVQAQPSADAAQAIKTLKFDQGLSVSLFASEPLLKNPVAFAPDERGRWFIAETFRQEKGVEDNRGHMQWLDDDIAAKTIEDRLAMMRKFYPDEKKFAERFAQHEERITCVLDTDGDGVADQSKVFADGFRDPLEGTGAGIIARGGEVWWTCIPSLWRFRDADGDGRADQQDKLLTGFGVKFAFRGHDMHGLRFGPDGKLYFTIGDRALNVTTPSGRKVEETETGAVMRCNPDGSGFELFATGVRNPQELAFNEVGDLFTGDNNSDGGDRARFVHVVEGGDSGWRMAYQYLNDRGPWNREKLWDEKEAPNAKYLVPPIANLGDGPSGLTFNPGHGLSAKYRGQFFLSDFRGGASASVVHAIVLEPKGAGYRLKERDNFVKGILTTDVEFGPDGALYVLDWVESWGGVGKGRIYKFAAKDADTAVPPALPSAARTSWPRCSPTPTSGCASGRNSRWPRKAQRSRHSLPRSHRAARPCWPGCTPSGASAKSPRKTPPPPARCSPCWPMPRRKSARRRPKCSATAASPLPGKSSNPCSAIPARGCATTRRSPWEKSAIARPSPRSARCSRKTPTKIPSCATAA
jgi:quinoprotein glucose dehydrogenase